MGYTTSFGAGGSDVYLIKVDSLGDTLWSRAYGGQSDDRGYSVQQTTDGGYILAGYTESFGFGGSDAYLIKTDADGDTLWSYVYGGVTGDDGASVQQTGDGGYIVAGRTAYSGGGDLMLTRLNSVGGTCIGEFVSSTVTSACPTISSPVTLLNSSATTTNLHSVTVTSPAIKVTTLCFTDVKDETGDREKPSEFALSQNYPNPFNPITKIEFTLARSSFVNLNVYDILGREVKSLVSGYLSPGYKSVLWDGKNEAGDQVASGVYLYKLEAGKLTETKKMVLLK